MFTSIVIPNTHRPHTINLDFFDCVCRIASGNYYLGSHSRSIDYTFYSRNTVHRQPDQYPPTCALFHPLPPSMLALRRKGASHQQEVLQNSVMDCKGGDSVSIGDMNNIMDCTSRRITVSVYFGLFLKLATLGGRCSSCYRGNPQTYHSSTSFPRLSQTRFILLLSASPHTPNPQNPGLTGELMRPCLGILILAKNLSGLKPEGDVRYLTCA